MTEPEIARRCPSCGASIRDLAVFCPQCGKQLSQQKPETAQTTTSVVTAPLVDVPSTDVPSAKDAVNAADPTRGAVPPVKESFETISEKREDPKLRDPGLKDQKAEGTARHPQKPTDGRAAAGAGRARIQRAGTLARDVEGDVIHRVQKLREISTVVLDEAAYDPSLRFLLVAAFMFLIFLVIVLLNKFLG
ncbi:MAG: zinc ribbon domain-containing protein [Acidobacteriota bacterium]|nr:zinc ribbon domain-containing protein [Acidobacteriota bacterium]